MGKRPDLAERNRANAKHGMHLSPEYTAWHTMKQRCNCKTHKAYPMYGGRGITVCDSWNASFEAFYADMGPRPSDCHTLDRIDNDKGYSPDNCRWATMQVQSSNRRTNRKITFNGETLTIAEWARRIGTSRQTIRNRLEQGWSDAEIITMPVNHGNRWRRAS